MSQEKRVMADFYNGLSRLKQEVHEQDMNIAEEEDYNEHLRAALKEIKAEEFELTRSVANLAISVQITQQELHSETVEKMTVYREFDEVLDAKKVAERKNSRKMKQLDNLKQRMFSIRDKFVDLHKTNYESYMKIPLVNQYETANQTHAETLEELAEKSSQIELLQNELKTLYKATAMNWSSFVEICTRTAEVRPQLRTLAKEVNQLTKQRDQLKSKQKNKVISTSASVVRHRPMATTLSPALSKLNITNANVGQQSPIMARLLALRRNSDPGSGTYSAPVANLAFPKPSLIPRPGDSSASGISFQVPTSGLGQGQARTAAKPLLATFGLSRPIASGVTPASAPAERLKLVSRTTVIPKPMTVPSAPIVPTKVPRFELSMPNQRAPMQIAGKEPEAAASVSQSVRLPTVAAAKPSQTESQSLQTLPQAAAVPQYVFKKPISPLAHSGTAIPRTSAPANASTAIAANFPLASSLPGSAPSETPEPPAPALQNLVKDLPPAAPLTSTYLSIQTPASPPAPTTSGSGFDFLSSSGNLFGSPTRSTNSDDNFFSGGFFSPAPGSSGTNNGSLSNFFGYSPDQNGSLF